MENKCLNINGFCCPSSSVDDAQVMCTMFQQRAVNLYNFFLQHPLMAYSYDLVVDFSFILDLTFDTES